MYSEWMAAARNLTELVPAEGLLPLYESSITAAITVACTFTLFFPNAAGVVGELTTYGKATTHAYRSLTHLIAVPKRWFRHFYLLGVLSIGFWIGLGWMYHEGIVHYNQSISGLLRAFTKGNPQTTFPLGMFMLTLLMIHVFRRCCETLFISVYSDTEMNIFHYLTGLLHYFLLPLAIVCDTEGFVIARENGLPLELPFPSPIQLAGLVVFLFANWQQNKIARYLADIRKDSDGLVRDHLHAICFGGWFEYISCPHFLLECLIYLSLWLISPSNAVLRSMVGFVMVNQVFAAQITHRWYRSHFSNYPIDRKAIIPFLL